MRDRAPTNTTYWKHTLFALAIAGLLLLAGCESAGTGGGSNGGGGDETPTLDPASALPDAPEELTDSGSSNPAAGYLQSSSTMFSAFAGFMEPPASAQSVESSGVSPQAIRTETRTWTSGGLTVTWTYKELADRHQWTVVWDGTYEVDGTTYTYTDWTLMEGHRLKNDYGGAFTIYDVTQPGSTDKAFIWEWCSDDSTGYRSYVFGMNDATDAFYFQITATSTGTEGELDVYDSGTGLSCGTAKTGDELLEIGWNSTGGAWNDYTDGSSDTWGTTPPATVDSPLGSGDDA